MKEEMQKERQEAKRDESVKAYNEEAMAMGSFCTFFTSIKVTQEKIRTNIKSKSIRKRGSCLKKGAKTKR